MSDLDFIFEAPQEEWEKRWKRFVLARVRKWQTVGLTEEEAADLYQLCAQRKLTTSMRRQWIREAKFRRNGNLKGLQYAALVFGKDSRTIRRWCEKGFFKTAKRNGDIKGHWRIDVREIEELRRSHPKGFGRGERSVFRTKEWKAFRKEAVTLWGEIFPAAVEMEAAFLDQKQSEFLKSPKRPNDVAISALTDVFRSGQLSYARLRYLARRLYLEDPERPITYRLIAQSLNIHLATLYRRFPRPIRKGAANKRELLDSAIKAASRPLSREETDLEGASNETMTDSIRDMFEELTRDSVIRDVPLSFAPDDSMKHP